MKTKNNKTIFFIFVLLFISLIALVQVSATGLTAEEHGWLETIYKEVKVMSIILILIAIGVFFFILAYTNKAIGVKILGYSITAWQLLIGLYIVYLNELDVSYTNILRTDFIGLLLVVGGIGFVMLFIFLTRMINVSDPMEEETDALKWSGNESKWNK